LAVSKQRSSGREWVTVASFSTFSTLACSFWWQRKERPVATPTFAGTSFEKVYHDVKWDMFLIAFGMKQQPGTRQQDN
jgi:hypothetical protein